MDSSRSLTVVSLAAGMALALALASIADGVIFRPLPVRRPSEIVRIFSSSPLHPLGFVSYPDYRDFARQARSLASIAAQSQVLLTVGTAANDPHAEMRMGLAVSANYFDALGVTLRLGRSFHPGEERQGVVVLSDSFWRTQYAADRHITGRTITIAHAPFTIVGVAPQGFGLDRFLHEDFYIPLDVYAAGLIKVPGRPWEDRSRRYLSLYARRIAPMPEVRAELAFIARELAREFPLTNRQQDAAAMTDLDARFATARSMQATAWILLAMAALSLFAGLSNACGLLLLRTEFRTREYAIKAALGASRLRLFLDGMREGSLLSGVAIAAAVPLAWAALKIARRLWEMPTGLPISMDARMDGRMIALAGFCSLLTALACGAVPFLKQRRGVRSDSLRETSKATTRRGIAIVQVALATALMADCASLAAGMISASRADLGYRTDHVLTMTFDPSQNAADEVRTRAFYHDLLAAALQVPGVRQTALAQSVPLGFTAAQKSLRIAAGGDAMTVWMNTVTPGYFGLMRMALLSGRDFDARDTSRTTPVVIVNQALAQLWPDGHALGRIVEIEGRKTEVIGIVRTAKYQQIGEAPRPFLYLCYEQNFAPRMSLNVLTEAPPASVIPGVVEIARGIDSAQSASEIRAMDEYLSHGALMAVRIGLTITGVTGSCAWILSLTGLYASIASLVGRRQREIGIRQAVGASRRSIVVMILLTGAKLIAAGSGLGLIAAAAAGRWTDSLSGQGGVLAWPALAAAMVVNAAGLCACLLPAWRAASRSPAVAFRRG